MRLKSSVGPAGLALWAACALLAGSIAMAQVYSFDPANADEQGPPGIRYFGAAKDEKGALVSGATIVLESGNASFMFVTDEQGRYRGNLPLESAAGKVDANCSKRGFTFVRVIKRPGPEGVKPTVQVDCVLRRVTQG